MLTCSLMHLFITGIEMLPLCTILDSVNIEQDSWLKCAKQLPGCIILYAYINNINLQDNTSLYICLLHVLSSVKSSGAVP